MQGISKGKEIFLNPSDLIGAQWVDSLKDLLEQKNHVSLIRQFS